MGDSLLDNIRPVTLKGQGVTLPHYRDLWTKCIELLPSDDQDYVKQLKIFSMNLTWSFNI